MPFKNFLTTLYEQTEKSYREDLNDFSRWFVETNGNEFAPGLITSIDLKEYQVHLLKVRGLKPATVNRRLAALRAWLNWCLEKEQIESLPRWPKRVAEIAYAPKGMTKIEQDRFIRAVEKDGSPRDKALVGLMLFAGLRVGEAVRVLVDDVEISERKGSVVVRHGKGMKRRKIPLGLEARNMIRGWLSRAKGKWLFPGQNAGNNISARAVQQMIKKYAWQAKIEPEKLTPHTLRHTFATKLLREGKDLVTVAAFLGHERLDTVARYTQPSYEDLENAVE